MLDVKKSNALRDAPRRKISFVEPIDCYLPERSFLQGTDERLFRERPIERKDNGIKENHCGERNRNPGPEAEASLLPGGDLYTGTRHSQIFRIQPNSPPAAYRLKTFQGNTPPSGALS